MKDFFRSVAGNIGGIFVFVCMFVGAVRGFMDGRTLWESAAGVFTGCLGGLIVSALILIAAVLAIGAVIVVLQMLGVLH